MNKTVTTIPSAASAIKHRDVSETVKFCLEQLMLQGYAPSVALEKYRYDLQLEHGDDHAYISADRTILIEIMYIGCTTNLERKHSQNHSLHWFQPLRSKDVLGEWVRTIHL